MKSFVFVFLTNFYFVITCVAQKEEFIIINDYQATALHYWSQKDYHKAQDVFLTLSEAVNKQLRLRTFFSKKEAIDYRQHFQKTFDLLFSFIETHPSDTLLSSIYGNVLQFHNASMDNESTLRQKLNYTDKETLQLSITRDSLLVQLGRQYELPLTLRKNVIALEVKVDSVETEIQKRFIISKAHFRSLSVELARQFYIENPSPSSMSCYLNMKYEKGNEKLANQLQDYAMQRKRAPLKWQYLCKELSSNEAAIEFVAYHYLTPEKTTDAIHYGAWVIRKNFIKPYFMPLCSQSELSLLLHDQSSDPFYIKYLYGCRKKNILTLYNLLWEPLEPILNGVKKIYYAPTGDLNRLNIAAICSTESDEPLQQKMEFIVVNSLRNLICENAKQEDKPLLTNVELHCLFDTISIDKDLVEKVLGDNICFDYSWSVYTKDVVIFGNVNYEMDRLAIKKEFKKTTKLNESIKIPEYIPKRKFNENGNWEALDHTKSEIDTLHKIFKKATYKVTVKEGFLASEEAFKALGKRKTTPRIIHLATHGFFLPDTALQNNENPLNRSGLILAGANYACKQGMPMMGMEDGILTAFEIGQMNLKNTELVVLSACETGLGFIDNNEGVHGLQRAFKRAGVKNLVVSLWSIPDEATKVLMTRFYENCLEKNMPIRVALKEAQNWMRQQAAYKNPYYWAAFVLLE